MEIFGASLGTIIWIACAIVCYYLAQAKGRNPIGWAIGGLFGGVIALIILVLIRPLNQ